MKSGGVGGEAAFIVVSRGQDHPLMGKHVQTPAGPGPVKALHVTSGRPDHLWISLDTDRDVVRRNAPDSLVNHRRSPADLLTVIP